MATPKKNVLGELERRIRRWLKDLDDVLAPKTPERARVPIPVRIRPEDRRPR